MADFKNYAASDIVVTWDGLDLTSGIAAGTFVTVERSEDSFSMNVGAGGDVTRVRSLNRTGAIKLTLMAASPVNDSLSSRLISDELFGGGTGTLMIQDLNGLTLVVAEPAWLKRPANIEFAAEASNREWEFEAAETTIIVGGSLS